MIKNIQMQSISDLYISWYAQEFLNYLVELL